MLLQWLLLCCCCAVAVASAVDVVAVANVSLDDIAVGAVALCAVAVS